MKKFLFIINTAITLSLLVGCKDSLEDDIFQPYEEQPISIFLEKQEKFSEWVKMLKRVDLYNTLNLSTDYTCFVADNEAVNAFFKEKGYNSIEDMPFEELDYIVRYHIISGGKYPSSSFSGMIPTETASGDYLIVKYGDDGINSMYVNNEALIVKPDMEAINGYVHQMDKVLDPIVETVWDLIKSNNNYSIFREALQLCGLEEYLQRKTRVLDENILKEYKTVFITSNETFAEYGINSLEDLKRYFPSQEYQSDSSAFYRYITYHIVESNSDFGDLATFSDDAASKLKNVSTLALYQMISIEDITGKLILNRHTDSIMMVEGAYDMQGNNGYVHEVNHLMPISQPQPAYMVWDFTDFDEFRVLEMYRYPLNGTDDPLNQNTYRIDRENAKNIEWFTIPYNDAAVRYQIRTGEGYATNDDRFWMNLGYVGWVKIQMPVVPAGTYKMSLYKAAWSTIRGKCQMYLDGEKIGPQLEFNTGGPAPAVLDNAKVFHESRGHEVMFRAIREGAMEIDRIVFEPVNN